MPADAADIVRAAGLDCHTVFDEHLAGRPDGELSAACLAERRILLTLDLDFGDIRRYPPADHRGIVLLRPWSPDRNSVLALVSRLTPLLATDPPDRVLWIVDETRVRIRGGS